MVVGVFLTQRGTEVARRKRRMGLVEGLTVAIADFVDVVFPVGTVEGGNLKLRDRVVI